VTLYVFRKALLACIPLFSFDLVGVLQEVDRTEKLLPVLENAGFSHLYASAPNKRHGCLIAWTNDKYSRLRTSLIDYDEQEVRVEGGDVARRGSTCRTTNIASLVALERRGDTNRGFIVATTHLFWHSRSDYAPVSISRFSLIDWPLPGIPMNGLG
jgi:hypothetical protein